MLKLYQPSNNEAKSNKKRSNLMSIVDSLHLKSADASSSTRVVEPCSAQQEAPMSKKSHPVAVTSNPFERTDVRNITMISHALKLLYQTLPGIHNQSDNDVSILGMQHQQEQKNSGIQYLMKCYLDGTPEMQAMLRNDINYMYECKMCRAVFRALPCLVKHKREFCKNTGFLSSVLDRSSQSSTEEDVAFQKILDALNPPERSYTVPTSSIPDPIAPDSPSLETIMVDVANTTTVLSQSDISHTEISTVTMAPAPAVTRSPLATTASSAKSVLRSAKSTALVASSTVSNREHSSPKFAGCRRKVKTPTLAMMTSLPSVTMTSSTAKLALRSAKSSGLVTPSTTTNSECLQSSFLGRLGRICERTMALRSGVLHHINKTRRTRKRRDIIPVKSLKISKQTVVNRRQTAPSFKLLDQCVEVMTIGRNRTVYVLPETYEISRTDCPVCHRLQRNMQRHILEAHNLVIKGEAWYFQVKETAFCNGSTVRLRNSSQRKHTINGFLPRESNMLTSAATRCPYSPVAMPTWSSPTSNQILKMSNAPAKNMVSASATMCPHKPVAMPTRFSSTGNEISEIPQASNTMATSGISYGTESVAVATLSFTSTKVSEISEAGKEHTSMESQDAMVPSSVGLNLVLQNEDFECVPDRTNTVEKPKSSEVPVERTYTVMDRSSVEHTRSITDEDDRNAANCISVHDERLPDYWCTGCNRAFTRQHTYETHMGSFHKNNNTHQSRLIHGKSTVDDAANTIRTARFSDESTLDQAGKKTETLPPTSEETSCLSSGSSSVMSEHLAVQSSLMDNVSNTMESSAAVVHPVNAVHEQTLRSALRQGVSKSQRSPTKKVTFKDACSCTDEELKNPLVSVKRLNLKQQKARNPRTKYKFDLRKPVCYSCNKKFTSLFNLKHHFGQVHSSKKLVSCAQFNCSNGKATVQEARIEDGFDKCAPCGTQYSSRGALLEHMSESHVKERVNDLRSPFLPQKDGVSINISISAEPNVSAGVEPNVSTGAEPNVSTGAKPNVSTSAKPNVSTGAKPNVSTGAKPLNLELAPTPAQEPDTEVTRMQSSAIIAPPGKKASRTFMYKPEQPLKSLTVRMSSVTGDPHELIASKEDAAEALRTYPKESMSVEKRICWKCAKRFMHISSLRDHVLKHLGIGYFACNLCQKWFLRRALIKRHFALGNHASQEKKFCATRYRVNLGRIWEAYGLFSNKLA